MSNANQVRMLIAYAVIAVATFGHAYVGIYEEQRPKFEAVRAQGKVPFGSPEEGAGYGALLCAMGWPLYWSVQAARATAQGGGSGK